MRVKVAESSFGATCAFATSNIIGRESKRTNNKIIPLDIKKNSGAPGYQDPVKIDLRTCAELLSRFSIVLPNVRGRGSWHKLVTSTLDFMGPSSSFFTS